MVGDSANFTPRLKLNTRSVSETNTPSNPDERSTPKRISPQVSYMQPVDGTTARVIPIPRGPSGFDRNRLESILNTDCSSTSTLSETDLPSSNPVVSGILNQAAQESIRNSSQLSSETALATRLEKEVLNIGRTGPSSNVEFSTPASRASLSNSPDRRQNNSANQISSPAVPFKVRSPSEIIAQEHKPNSDSATTGTEPAVLAANNQNQVSEPNTFRSAGTPLRDCASRIPAPNFPPTAHILPGNIQDLASSLLLSPSQADARRPPSISLSDDAYKALMTKLGNRHERDNLFSLRVNELKLVLSKYNLSKGGLKADLRDTIIYYITSITDEAKKAQVWKYIKEVSDARRQARYHRYTILPIQHSVPVGPLEKICPTILGDETKIQLKADPKVSLVCTVTRLMFSATTNISVEIQILLTASQLGLFDSKEHNGHSLILHCIKGSTADTPDPPMFFPLGCHGIYFGGRFVGSNHSGPLKLYNEGPLSNLTPLKLTWHRPHNETYIIVVEIVRAKSQKEILDDILINCFKSKEDILKTRYTRLGEDDDDIESGAEIVSLKDPITMGRITIPARGKSCNHIQCFDAETFMVMNSNLTEPRAAMYGMRYPECPVCYSKLPISDMIIDGYFKEILDTTSTECEQIQVESDGKWTEFEKPIVISSSSKRKSGVVLDIDENHKKPHVTTEVICLSDTDDEEATKVISISLI